MYAFLEHMRDGVATASAHADHLDDLSRVSWEVELQGGCIVTHCCMCLVWGDDCGCYSSSKSPRAMRPKLPKIPPRFCVRRF